MRTLRKLAPLILILATCGEMRATVLYVRYSSNQIVIATDSKRTAETGDTVCVCKIAQIGDTFIASAGLAEYGGFDPKNFAREAIQNSKTLLEMRERFEQLLYEPLVDVLQRIKKRNPARYEVFKKGAAVNMVFARFQEQPELVVSALTPEDRPDGSIILVKHPITLIGPVARSQRIFVGVSKRAEVLLDKPYFWSRGVVPAVQRILEISIQDNKEAGGPIDLIQLTKGGVRWIPTAPRCDEKSRRINEQPSSCNSSATHNVSR